MTDASQKPSDRIHELAAKHAPPNHLYGPNELAWALLDYLDEQHDMEKRRNAVRSALAMVGPGGSIIDINRQLDLAGLPNDVCVGMNFYEWKRSIVSAAEKAGLL